MNMKIPYHLELTGNEKPNIYLIRFFEFLQGDKLFEKLTISAVYNVRRLIPEISKMNANRVSGGLIISTFKKLRSEEYFGNLSGIPFPEKTNKKLDEIAKPILDNYPFMAQWKYGLVNFILGGSFIVPNEYQPIKLRITNSKKEIPHRLLDSPLEDGVKLVITGNISRGYITKWIKDNWPIIEKGITGLATTTKQKTNRPEYEKGLLYFYLKKYTKYQHWGDIKKLTDSWGNGEEQEIATIKNTCKRFPYCR
jgi:hypothetical protein